MPQGDKGRAGESAEQRQAKATSASADLAGAYGEAKIAARRTLDQAEGTVRSLVDSGRETLVVEAERRPVTLALAALAIGFIFGRAL